MRVSDLLTIADFLGIGVAILMVAGDSSRPTPKQDGQTC